METSNLEVRNDGPRILMTLPFSINNFPQVEKWVQVHGDGSNLLVFFSVFKSSGLVTVKFNLYNDSQ